MHGEKKVIIRKCGSSTYQILECGSKVKDEVWKDNVSVGKSMEPLFFHQAWLVRLREVCEKYKIEIIVEKG